MKCDLVSGMKYHEYVRHDILVPVSQWPTTALYKVWPTQCACHEIPAIQSYSKSCGRPHLFPITGKRRERSKSGWKQHPKGFRAATTPHTSFHLPYSYVWACHRESGRLPSFPSWGLGEASLHSIMTDWGYIPPLRSGRKMIEFNENSHIFWMSLW